MAVITYRDIIPSLIENATMRMMMSDGVDRAYMIEAVDGYVLRDNRRDWTDIDPETGDEIPMEGYMSGTISVAATYDFVANPFDIRAVLESEVPADQIFGGGGNDHEAM